MARVSKIPSDAGESSTSDVHYKQANLYQEISPLIRMPGEHSDYFYQEFSLTHMPQPGNCFKFKYFVVSLIAVLVLGYSVLYLQNNGCPDYEPKQNFEMSKYFGTWFEMYRPKDVRFEVGECVASRFVPSGSMIFSIINSQQLSDGSVQRVAGQG